MPPAHAIISFPNCNGRSDPYCLIVERLIHYLLRQPPVCWQPPPDYPPGCGSFPRQNTMSEYTVSTGLPSAQGLYDPRHEHDACGIGFVANIKGQKSHDIDRKSTRLNSSHLGISYAVFCLKKKK